MLTEYGKMCSHILGVNRVTRIEVEHGKEITGKENKTNEKGEV